MTNKTVLANAREIKWLKLNDELYYNWETAASITDQIYGVPADIIRNSNSGMEARACIEERQEYFRQALRALNQLSLQELNRENCQKCS